MKINYQETSDDLLARIDIHARYGARDIDAWMLDLLAPRKGSHILDAGCGAGKQCFAYHRYLQGQADITGGDPSPELLAKARQENERTRAGIRFIELDFNERLPVENDAFDLVSCCFAIYYAEDIHHTVREFHRIIKSGGRLFTSGPMPTNKRLFYDVIQEATGRAIPPMPGSSRYGTQILAAIQSKFRRVEANIFENPLTFAEAGPFLDYTRASLSEDRKLWSSFFTGKDDFEKVMAQIEAVAHRRLEAGGPLVMTKVVGGFVAYK